MREFIGLYRGKRIDNGEWVEGYLLSYEDGRARICARHTDIFCYEKDSSIIQTIAHEVVPVTVGECTGLRDKNGKLIFEGDIIKNWTGLIFVVKFGQHIDDECEIESYGWFVSNDERTLSFGEDWGGHEIIGNVTDNPELLKGGEGNG